MATLKITRAQLAAFLPDHESIKQFEALFTMAEDAATSLEVEAINAMPAPVSLAAEQALRAVDELRNEMASMHSDNQRLMSVIESLQHDIELMHAAPARYVETVNDKYGQVTIDLSDIPTATSAELAAIISDETGSGALVFADTPTFSSAANSVVTSHGLSGIGSFKAKSSGTNLAKITFENVTTGELASISANNSGSVDFKNSAGTLVARFDATTLAAYFDLNVADDLTVGGDSALCAGGLNIVDNLVDAIEINNNSFLNTKFYSEGGTTYRFNIDGVDYVTISEAAVTLPSTTSIGTVSSTELGYLDGVTSAIQTQLAARALLAGSTSQAFSTAALTATGIYYGGTTAGIAYVGNSTNAAATGYYGATHATLPNAVRTYGTSHEFLSVAGSSYATISATGASVTGALSATTSLTIGTSITPDSGGIKHKRVTTGSIAAGTTALVTVTWGTAFADANYTVTASVLDSTTTSLSLSVVHVESISASAVTVRVLNNALGSLTGTLHVTALHD